MYNRRKVLKIATTVVSLWFWLTIGAPSQVSGYPDWNNESLYQPIRKVEVGEYNWASCSLADAILAANTDSPVGGCPAGDGDDLIDLSALSGVIDLTDPLPPITSNITLIGSGASNLTIRRASSGDPFRIFDVQAGSVLIAGLTLSGGEAASGGAIFNAGDLTLQGVVIRDSQATSSGGGIYNTGNLTLTVGSAIENNQAESSGGGIYNAGGLTLIDSSVIGNITGSSGAGIYSSGSASIRSSTFTGNIAVSAGGAAAQADGELTLINSTLSGNQAGAGGALYVGGGSAHAENVTAAGNRAAQVGGVLNQGGFTFANTILSDNRGGDCGGTLASMGFNLVQDSGGCLIEGDGDGLIIGQSARLAPLGFSGGLTLVQMPEPDSPVVDAGGGACAATDQRGGSRSGTGRCDIGAVEVEAVTPVQWIAATSGNWTTASNWSTGVVPGAADEVILDVPAKVTVTINANVTVSKITSHEHLLHTGGTVTVSAASVFDGAYTLNGGTLAGTGARTFNGPFTWVSGTISGTGLVQSNGSFTLSGTGAKYLAGATFTNTGLASWTDGSFYLNTGAVFQNAVGGVFSANAAGSAIGNSSTPLGLFDNAGLFTAAGRVVTPWSIQPDWSEDAALLIATTGAIDVNVPFNNSGMVTVSTGTLDLNAGGSASGTFGSGVNFAGGTYTLTNGAAVAGTISGATVTIADGTTVSGSGMTLAGGTISIGAGSTASIGGSFAWTGGTIRGMGTLHLIGQTTVSSTSFTKYLRDSVTLVNDGTLTWTAGTIYAYDSIVFQNAVGGVFDAQTNGYHFAISGGTGQFDNLGTVTRTVSTTNPTTFDLPFNNSGIVEPLAGTISIASGSGSGILRGSGGQIDITSYTLTDGAKLEGSLTFDSGTLITSGVSTASGNLTWAGGTIRGTGTLHLTGQTTVSNASISKFLRDSVTLVNDGTLTWTAGTITAYDSIVFQNAAGGVFDAQTNGYHFAISSGTGHFDNFGTVTRTVSATNPTTFDLPFNNDGMVMAQTGAINLSGGGSGYGTFGSGVNFAGGTFTLTNGAAVAGTISGATVTIADGTTVSGSGMTLSGGTISVGAGSSASIGGSFAWTGGTIRGMGTLHLTGQTSVSGTSVSKFLRDSITVVNDGTITWTAGTITSYDSSVFQNAVGGVFDAQTNGYHFAISGGTGQFDNFGTVTRTVSTTNPTTFDLPFNNSGVIEPLAGTISIASGSGSGILRGSGGQIDITSYTLTDGAKLEGSLTFDSGTLITSGVSTASGNLTWAGGTIRGTGTLHLTGQTTVINASISKFLRDSITVVNDGTLTWTAGTITAYDSIVFQNAAGGIFDAQTNGYHFAISSGTGHFDNFGTVTRTMSAVNPTIFDLPFNNSGTVRVDTGTLTFNGGLTQTSGALTLNGGAISGTTLTLNGGTLSGAGTVSANVVNNAIVNVGNAPGQLSITGTYTQGASGVLNIEIGGTVAGTGYDRIAVSSAASLNGTLNLSLINGYDPPLGTAFDVFTFASRTGTFASINGTALGGGKQFSVAYSGTKATINTIAAP